jgi:acetyl esterase
VADALAAGASGPPLYELSPADARQVLRDVQASVPVELEPAEVHDRSIEGGPTGAVELRIVRPERRGGALPVVLYTHGGGWILGDKDTHERLVREVADAAGAVVVFVDYTPAPEAHYPVQNEQAYAALEWVARHAAEVGGDPSRIAIMGDSVGGRQVLLYPVTDADFETPTYERYADGPWLTRPAMQWFWDAYTPDVVRRAEPTACIGDTTGPVRAPQLPLQDDETAELRRLLDHVQRGAVREATAAQPA